MNIYNNFPSSKNSELIFWGDINTYSQTITNEVYVEYYSFDVPTQKISILYDNEPDTHFSVCSNDLLKEVWEDDYITFKDLECVIDLLNNNIPIYRKTKK